MSTTVGEGHVPVIDLSQEESVCSRQLFDALTSVGFACLTNTGLWDMAKEYSRVANEFFEQSEEIKSRYSRHKSLSDNVGWVSIGREQLSSERPGDYKECFNMMRRARDNKDRVPEQIDSELGTSLWDKFVQVSHKVNHLIGLGLHLQDPDFISKTHNYEDVANNRSALRINWYPAVDKDKVKAGQIRCGEHSDYGSITLLYSDSPGLQVLNRQTKQFVDAGFVEGGIFVNIGDLLQMWSSDVLVANKHRVLIPDDAYINQNRMSVVFFSQPDDSTLIESLDGQGKYPPITSGGWLLERFQATYDK